MSALRLLLTTSAWALATCLLLLLASLALPRLVGGGSFTVVTGSMRGSVEVGDQVIVLPRPASEVEVGEIVAFKDPEGTGRLLQHRVQAIKQQGRELEVVTMGDANTGYERWRVAKEGRIDKVMAVLPMVGYLIGPITKPIVRAALAAVSWATLLFIVLFALWRPPKAEVV